MSPVVILVCYAGEVNAATVPDWISLVLNIAVGLVFARRVYPWLLPLVLLFV